ncbi:MAG: hypothetical protein JW843_09600 [Candidatus Aminicenantes bacterium]|nr:hypothetical protein [Candidatus Aminicenantes bacterium]
MNKVVFIARNFHEADLRDIEQNISMNPAQRQRAARIIKRRLFGANRPDVRAVRPRG